MFFWAAWDVLVQLAPWMLLGTVIAGLVHVLLPPGFIHRRLQGFSGVLKAVGIGVPLPPVSSAVATIGAVYRRFGGRVLAVYLGAIIAGSVPGAVTFEAFLSGTVIHATPAVP